MSKPLFPASRDLRTPREKFQDRLAGEHEDGLHADYIQLDCPICEAEEVSHD